MNPRGDPTVTAPGGDLLYMALQDGLAPEPTTFHFWQRSDIVLAFSSFITCSFGSTRNS